MKDMSERPEIPVRASQPYPQKLIFAPEPPFIPTVHSYAELADEPLTGAITITTPNQTGQLITTPLAIRSVTLVAASTNAGQIFVGGNEAQLPLAAGASTTLRLKDLSRVYVRGTVASDIVFYIAEIFKKAR